MFLCLNSTLECSSNLEKVIILRARLCSIRERVYVGVVCAGPHNETIN